MSVVCGDGKEVYAHQSILTAWSSHFREELRKNLVKHPIVFLPKEFGGWEFAALVEYMYTGQACVSEEKLQAFMDGARYLGIKGLAVVSCTADHGEAKASQDLTQDLSQDSEHDMGGDSSSKEDAYSQDWSQDGMQAMTQDRVTKHVRWSDVVDAEVAWALRVPLGEDYGNKDCLDCQGFY